MTPVVINLSAILELDAYTKNQFDYIMDTVVHGVTDEIYKRINSFARDNLKTSRKTYLDSLHIEHGEKYGRIWLDDGGLAEIIESGAPQMDLKDFFANSRKAIRTDANKRTFKDKNGKMHWKDDKGWYLTIPFRIGTPTSLAEEFSSKMPNEIYNVARRLKATLLDKEVNKTRFHKSITMSDLSDIDKKSGTQHHFAGENEGIINKDTGATEIYEHKSPKFLGMIKVQGDYGKTSQNTYMTFRRVSSNSDPNSWIRKATQGKNFFDRAEKEIDSVINDLMVHIIDVLFQK